jgi:hypothetical protein
LEWLEQFETSEWDFHDLMEMDARARKKASTLMARAHHRIAVSMLFSHTEAGLDRIRLASEVLQELGGVALLLRLPRALKLDPAEGARAVARARRELTDHLELWADPGEEFFCGPAPAPGQPAIHWIADPLWHPQSSYRRAQILKLHGWHPARWIRYYGTEQLQLALKRSAKARVLLLGHSQREEEAQRLIFNR